MPGDFSGQTGGDSLKGKWWKKFGDEKLNVLINEALEENLDIEQAYERLRQAQAALEITGASKGVFLDIKASAGRARQSGFLEAVTSDTYSLSTAAAYELDVWNRIASETGAAGFEMRSSEEGLKAMFVSISAQVAELYFAAVEQRAQLELSGRTIASFSETAEMVERRYQGGLVPAIDVYQARQNLASAIARKPVYESGLSVALNALSVLTGRYPGQDIGGDEKELPDAPSFPAGLPSRLLTCRPDVRAALMRVYAGDRRVAAAVAERFPSFNLSGSYGGASDKLRSVLDSPDIVWNVLLQAVQPVLDAGRRKAEVERSEAVLREALALYHQTVINAFSEVEDALARIRANRQRIKALEETVDISENSLRIALERYMQGLTDYLPVLTEQLRHFNAKRELISARRKQVSDHIQLARALGGDWMEDVLEEYMNDKKAERKK